LRFPNESTEYRKARDELLEREIELRRNMEAVAAARRDLPQGGEVSEDYEFEVATAANLGSTVRLSELFGSDQQSLAVYCYMFPRHPGDDREPMRDGALVGVARDEQPCPSCTAFLDQLDGAAPHICQNLSLAVVAGTSPERLAAVGRERGWRHLRLLSSRHNTFKRDYHGEDAGSEQPMMNIFHRSDGTIRHFWASEMLWSPTDPGQDPRHNGTLEPLWNIFDLTPEGRPDWHEQLQYDHDCA
jgi:predicted dithiol-disulfide oxidoreductase (DUF899 family)